MYAPTAEADEEETDSTRNWKILCLTFQAKIVTVIGGDFNAKVGKINDVAMCMRRVGLGKMNEAAQKLTDFCEEQRLVIQALFSRPIRADCSRGHRLTDAQETKSNISYPQSRGEEL